jgi:hypothetical protein
VDCGEDEQMNGQELIAIVILGGLSGACAAVGILRVNQKRPPPTNRIEMADATGHRVEIRPDGMTFSKNGLDWLTIRSDDKWNALTIFGPDSKAKLELSVSELFSLIEVKHGIAGAELASDGSGGDLALMDLKGYTRLNVTSSPSASLRLFDEDRNMRAALGAVPLVMKASGSKIERTESSLVLFDSKGDVKYELPFGP